TYPLMKKIEDMTDLCAHVLCGSYEDGLFILCVDDCILVISDEQTISQVNIPNLICTSLRTTNLGEIVDMKFIPNDQSDNQITSITKDNIESLHPDNVAIATSSGGVRIMHLPTQRCIYLGRNDDIIEGNIQQIKKNKKKIDQEKQQQESVLSVDVSFDGNWIVTASKDKSVSLWTRLVKRIQIEDEEDDDDEVLDKWIHVAYGKEHTASVMTCALSHKMEKYKIINEINRNQKKKKKHQMKKQMDIDDDEEEEESQEELIFKIPSFCVSSGEDRTMKLWDVAQSAREYLQFEFSDTKDQQKMKIDKESQSKQIHQQQQQQQFSLPLDLVCVTTVISHTKEVNCIAVAPNDQLAATGSQDKTIKLWRMIKNEINRRKKKNKKKTKGIQNKQKSEQIIGGDDDGFLQYFGKGSKTNTTSLNTSFNEEEEDQDEYEYEQQQLYTIEQSSELKGHKRGIWNIAFASGVRLMASASGDGTVRIWSMTQTQSSSNDNNDDNNNNKESQISVSCIRVLEGGHTGAILQCSFIGTNGQQLITSGGDGTVKLWIISTGEEIGQLDGRCVGWDEEQKMKRMRGNKGQYNMNMNVDQQENEKEKENIQIKGKKKKERVLKLVRLYDEEEEMDKQEEQDEQDNEDEQQQQQQQDHPNQFTDADMPEDRIWALCISDEKGQRIGIGSADGKMIIWEDVTNQFIESERREKEELLQTEQLLDHALAAGQLERAFILALDIGQPQQMHKIVSEIIKTKNGGITLQKLIQPLIPPGVSLFLDQASEWCTQRRTGWAAQEILKCILTSFNPKFITALPHARESIQSLIAYTGREGTNRQFGYAFIEFESSDQAAEAVRATAEQRKIDGVEVTIQFSSNHEKEHASLPSSQSPAPAPIIFTVTSSLQVPLPPSPSQQKKNQSPVPLQFGNPQSSTQQRVSQSPSSQSPSAQRQKKSSPSVKHINNTSVHFTGIPTECDRDEIIELAEQFGEIATTPFYPPSNAPFRYINIEYKTHQSADAAVHSSTHKRQLHGATIRADWQEGKSDSPASYYFSESDQVYNPAQNKQRKSPPAPRGEKQPSPSAPRQKKSSPSAEHSDNTSVHFSWIPADCDREEVAEFAQQFGYTTRVFYCPPNGTPYRFANIEYKTHESANAAVHSSNKQRLLHDETVIIDWMEQEKIRKSASAGYDYFPESDQFYNPAQNKQRISPPVQPKPAQLQSQQVSEPQLLKPRISPPPNPNYTKVHFAGIPEQSLYEEVKNLTHQFGEVKDGSFQFHEQDDSSEGFANVDYQTHQVAESAVNSSDEKRLLHGVIVSVQWDTVTQQQKISSTPPPKPKLQPNQLVYIPEQSQISSSETNTRQYSPPPNTNNKRVHFAGIPVESSELEVREFTRQFGLQTSFFYRSYDDGSEGFANVEYQTHEQAQAAVASNRQNILNGQHIHIYWSKNQQRQQNRDQQNDDKEEQNSQYNEEDDDEDEDDDYFESGRNAVIFQGFGIAQKRYKMMEYIKKFGDIQKFLSPHIPLTQEQIREQGFQTALVEYIEKEDMERAIESSGSNFEGFTLKIYKSTFRGDQNDNKPKTKHPKGDDQKIIRKYKKPNPQTIEELKGKLTSKRQKLNQLEREYNEKREQQKKENEDKEEQKKGEERLDLEGITPIIEFRWLHDSVNEKTIREKIEEYCDENDENIGKIEDLKVFHYEVHKRAHITFETPEDATLIFKARKEKKIKFDGESDNDNDSDDDEDGEDDNSDDDDKKILVCYQEPFLWKSLFE
ncbi:MAG: hypothetical protein EZS28_017496, partial [Streblomastix strix]